MLGLAVGFVVIGCGGDGDEKITDSGECEEQLSDYLIDEYENGDLADRILGGVDSDELSDAIDETTDEFCNEVEVESGVEIDEIDSRAKADLVNRLGAP